MIRPPEYDRVALWLRALNGEPGPLEDIQAGHPGPDPVLGTGLTRGEYARQQRQRLADQAQRELFSVSFDGIDLGSANLDQVAEAYHRQQVADYAHRQHVLQERLRGLADGDFEVPSWCPARAAQHGTDLGVVIEDYRQGALLGTGDELGLLRGRCEVTEGEVQAYWAARHHAAVKHLIDEHHAEPHRVARDAPTLDRLESIHGLAHEYLGQRLGMDDDPHGQRQPPWGLLVMQAQADDWWAERDRHYRNRPEILQEIEQLRSKARNQAAAEAACLESLERRAEAGSPGAQRALEEELTRQALETDAPEPSAREHAGEWKAFFREVLGRDMPQNASYEAEQYRIDAAAPPDVGGMAAAYYEASYPTGFDHDELAAERDGLTLEQLCLQRYQELQASMARPGPAATAPETAGLAAMSFPGPVQASPSQRVGQEPARPGRQSGPRATWRRGR